MTVSTNFNPLAERLRKIRATQDLIAKLTGISPMALSRAANHQCDLSYGDWRRVETAIADLEEIVARAGVNVDWKNHQAIKEKLADLETERASPPPLPSPEDWRLMSEVCTGRDTTAIATELSISLSDLVEKLRQADTRFQYSVHQLRQGTRDANDLIAANRAAFDEQHSK